jgi:hypothetical protein
MTLNFDITTLLTGVVILMLGGLGKVGYNQLRCITKAVDRFAEHIAKCEERILAHEEKHEMEQLELNRRITKLGG